jgi:hypothetical protein
MSFSSTYAKGRIKMFFLSDDKSFGGIAFKLIPCNLCGSQENLQRAMLNEMLREWDKQYPKRLHSIFGALQA